MITLRLYNHLVDTACEKMDITRKTYDSRTQRRAVVHTRWIVWAIMRDVFEMSYPAIGKYCHRDHTTVVNGLRELPRWFEREPDLQAIHDAVVWLSKGVAKGPVVTIYGIKEMA